MGNILISNGIIITMNPANTIIHDGALYVENNKIIDVGKSDYITKNYSADIEIDASGKAIIPGLINTHTHLFQTLMKGLGDDRSLWDWGRLIYNILPYLTQEEIYQGILSGCIEMIKSGTTCFIDFEKEGGTAIKAYKFSGIRGILARCFKDTVPDFYTESQKKSEQSLESKDEILQDLDRLIRTYNNSENGRIKVMPAPISTYKCTKEVLIAARKMAYKYKTGFTIHLNETKPEAEYCMRKHGVQEIEYAFNLNLLNRDTVIAHCVWTSEKEIDILAKTEATCAHNPESNMILASGIAPIPEMIKKGVNVSLATDGPASNNNLDMFEAMRFAALLHKVNYLDPKILNALDVLKMATTNGARALNLEKSLGSLEKGKLADIVVINLKRPNTTPIYDAVSNLIYCANGDNVDIVIIDGKILLQDRKLTKLDETDILEKTQHIAERVKRNSYLT